MSGIFIAAESACSRFSAAMRETTPTISSRASFADGVLVSQPDQRPWRLKRFCI